MMLSAKHAGDTPNEAAQAAGARVPGRLAAVVALVLRRRLTPSREEVRGQLRCDLTPEAATSTALSAGGVTGREPT